MAPSAKLVVVLQYLVTFIAALPTRHRTIRESVDPEYHVVQIPEIGLGLVNHTHQITGESYAKCIAVNHPNVPTRLEFLGYKLYQTRYEIKGYHGVDCDDTSGSTTSLNFDDQINKRTPVCSFQLNYSDRLSPTANVTVAFVGESPSSPSHTITLPASDTSCNRGLCFYPQVAYAHSVNITVNGKNAYNSIRLFKDVGCEEPIRQDADVGHRHDLVQLTRDSVEIKSFRVSRR